MSKKQRIELLEQRVAELMGEVERLKGQVSALEAIKYVPATYPTYPKPPYVPWADAPIVPYADGPTTMPFEITSHTVDLNDDPVAAKVLYQNRWELYG